MTRDDIDTLIAGGKLPEGRPVGELLMHYDAKSEQLVPDANAAFLYITREGSMGVIETTDRITRTADLTGIADSPSSGGVSRALPAVSRGAPATFASIRRRNRRSGCPPVTPITP